MKVDKHSLANMLAFDEISSSGSNCSFIDLENGWGVKCFVAHEDRDTSYYCQKHLSTMDLAPKALQRFTIVDQNGDEWFCFLTEVAEPIVEYGIGNSHCCGESDEDEDEFHMLYRDERDEYVSKLYDETQSYYLDDHAGNYGFITRKGKQILVAIDFDTCWELSEKIQRERKENKNARCV